MFADQADNVTILLTNSTTVGPDFEKSLNSLYPAIIQCFSIILIGYIAGRAGLITANQGQGVSRFVSTFALPALIFHSLAKLDFSTVNWSFLAAICIGKSALFLIVSALVLIIKRPLNFGYAGLFGIFATQSNDFAIGYSLIKAIYQDSHPDFLQYIYLVAPISFCIINPVGFIFMEVEMRRSSKSARTKCGLIWAIVKGVITNPVVFMSVIGLIANVLSGHHLPLVLDQPIETLGNAFSATALFYLGLTLVGKVKGQLGAPLLVSLLLVFAKLLLLPFLIIECVSVLHPSANVEELNAYKLYGYLYGTFPTAPGVLFYAAHYGIASNIISSSMVLCTVMSAPLIFVSAMMVSMTFMNLDYLSVARDTAFDVSILTLIFSTFVIIIFVTSKKITRVPHQLTACLSVCQIILSVGMMSSKAVFTSQSVPVPLTAAQYIVLSIQLIGIFGSRIFSCLIAVQVYLITCRSLCSAVRVKNTLIVIGFCLPVLIVGLMLVLGTVIPDESTSQAYFGRAQTITAATVLITSCVIIIITLILYYRRTHGPNRHQSNTASATHGVNNTTGGSINSDYTEKVANSDTEDENGCDRTLLTTEHRYGTINEDGRLGDKSTGIVNKGLDIEDIVTWPKASSASTSDTDENVPNSTNSKVNQRSGHGAGTHSHCDFTIDTASERGIEQHLCTLSEGCNTEQRQKCRVLLRNYKERTTIVNADQDEIESEFEDSQIGRHVAFLICLVLSMICGIFTVIWQLVNGDDLSSIYVELLFMDSVLNMGQGFFTFAFFGLDKDLIVIPIMRRLRQWWYGSDRVVIPPVSELSEDVKRVCNQFRTHHMTSCQQAIGQTIRERLWTHQDAFRGPDLIGWLLEVGLCKDETEATEYGESLLLGRVIHHVRHLHHFTNAQYIYRFTSLTDY